MVRASDSLSARWRNSGFIFSSRKNDDKFYKGYTTTLIARFKSHNDTGEVAQRVYRSIPTVESRTCRILPQQDRSDQNRKFLKVGSRQEIGSEERSVRLRRRIHYPPEADGGFKCPPLATTKLPELGSFFILKYGGIRSLYTLLGKTR